MRECWRGKWGGCFGLPPWKKIGGVAVLISFRLTWDGCSSLLAFGGVLSFRLEAREALVSETARDHHAVWRCGSRVAARGAREAAREATDCRVLGRQHIFGGE